MRPSLVCVALTALLVPSASGAQSLPLTEAQALARLSSESARARALRADIPVARAAVLDASRWPNPRATVDREAVAGVSETLTTVLQPLPITGRRGLERRAATAFVEAATSRADDAFRRLRADVRLAFADLVGAQARERELTLAVDRLRELAVMLQRREAAGDAAGFDRLRAEREAAEVDADRTLAVADRARAQAVLAGYLADVAEPGDLVAAEVRPAATDLPPIDLLVEHAETTRGDVRALQREIEAFRLAEAAAGRRRVPEPEIVAGTKSSSALGGDVGIVFAVQAVLPLFDRGQPERALAVARESQSQAHLDALRGARRAEIAAWRVEALARRTAADVYRTSARAAVDDIDRIARISYDAGERGILELLDAYRTSAAARVRQATLDLAARQAEIELEFVSGWEIP